MAEVVGLDIGASAVRAAEIEVGSGGAALVSYGQVGLPPGVIVDGEIRDESAVADALRRLWENSQFSTRSVVVGLAGLRAITREIDLPYVADDEVESAVRFQSEEVIPFPVDKTILSSQVLADFQSPDGAKMRRVLVAAAHQELVDGVVRTVTAAELEVEGVDLVSSALVRALGDVNDEPEAIVSVGAGLTVVVIFEQGRPQFVRTIGTAGNAMTAAIASALDLPLPDAEALKRRIGDGSAQVQAAQRAVQPIVTELVTETRNSLQYFASQPGRRPIRRIMATGGGSRLSGLIEQLQEQTRIPVHAVSPLARLDLSRVDLRPEQAAAIDPVLAAPIGLALPEPNPAVKKFNLVPPEILQQAQVRRFKSYAMVGAAGLVVLAGLFGGLRTYQVVSAHSGVSGLQGQIAAVKTEVPKYNGPLAAANAARSAQQQLTTLTSPALDWYNVLVRLANRTPDGLEVSGLTATQSGASAPSAAASSGSGTSSSSSASTQCSTSGGGSSGGGASSTLPPGSLGALSMAVSGTYQGDPHFDPAAAWGTQIQEVSASGDPVASGGKVTAWFGQPTLTAVSNCSAGGQTTVSFSTTVPVLAPASLTNDGNFFYNG